MEVEDVGERRSDRDVEPSLPSLLCANISAKRNGYLAFVVDIGEETRKYAVDLKDLEKLQNFSADSA